MLKDYAVYVIRGNYSKFLFNYWNFDIRAYVGSLLALYFYAEKAK